MICASWPNYLALLPSVGRASELHLVQTFARRFVECEGALLQSILQRHSSNNRQKTLRRSQGKVRTPFGLQSDRQHDSDIQ